MIKIKTRDLEEIIAHCREELPIEACGILAGEFSNSEGITVKEVLKVYPCRNELNSATEYRIDPEEQFKVFNEIHSAEIDLLGFYHSHVSPPYTSSIPSSIDRERANYVGYSYLIISLHPTKVSSWILHGKGLFKEEEIQTL
jgi:proteasome lid subunit RPN8/RPN11